MHTQGRLFFALAFACLLFPPAKAAAACADSICVDTVPHPGGIALWATSTVPGSSTISLEIAAQNLASLQPTPAVFILSGPGRTKLIEEKMLREEQPWKISYRFFAQQGKAGATPTYAFRYGIPFEKGFSVRISQGFHGQISHVDEVNQYAIDFDVPENTPLFAAREGIVVAVVSHFTKGGASEPVENVNVVKVEHADHTVAEYAHLRADGAAVKIGQKVMRGELLGYSGSTGQSNGPHLHFAVHLPNDGKTRRSIPILFSTEDENETALQEGKTYRRP